jgi:hypothetical protein
VLSPRPRRARARREGDNATLCCDQVISDQVIRKKKKKEEAKTARDGAMRGARSS